MLRNEIPACHNCVYRELLKSFLGEIGDSVDLLTRRIDQQGLRVLPISPERDAPLSPADRRPSTPLVTYSLSPQVEPLTIDELETKDIETVLRESDTETVPMTSDSGDETTDEPIRRYPTPYHGTPETPVYGRQIESPVSPLIDLDTSTQDWDLYPVAPPPLEMVRHVIHVDSDGETEVHFEVVEATPPPNQLACSWCVDDEPSSSDVDRPRRRTRKRREDVSRDLSSPKRLAF